MELDMELKNENIKKIIEGNYIDRNRYLNGLLNILNTIKDNKIIALDGEWGSGKTWFLKSLEYLINNKLDFETEDLNLTTLASVKEQYMTFYYNAWENDDAPSAMLSIIYKLVNDSILKQDQDKTSIIPRLLNTLIKYGTAGALDIKSDMLGEQWTKKQIADEIKTSEEIKETFKELINNLRIENKNRILVIIDEIDRCKPLFAIEVLENIKHFYDDHRIIFLVATNNRQLSASICGVYGEKYDGNAYLDKFFDLNMELPDNYIEKYIMAIDKNTVSRQFKDMSCRELAKIYKLNMRTYNRYIKSINMIEKYLIRNEYMDYLLTATNHIFVPIALMLKINNKNKYYEFISGKLFDEIEKLINTSEYFRNLSKRILMDRRVDKINEIKRLQISEEDKKKQEDIEIIANIKEIYGNLFSQNKDDEQKWEYDEEFKELQDIISMMS